MQRTRAALAASACRLLKRSVAGRSEWASELLWIEPCGQGPGRRPRTAQLSRRLGRNHSVHGSGGARRARAWSATRRPGCRDSTAPLQSAPDSATGGLRRRTRLHGAQHAGVQQSLKVPGGLSEATGWIPQKVVCPLSSAGALSFVLSARGKEARGAGWWAGRRSREREAQTGRLMPPLAERGWLGARRKGAAATHQRLPESRASENICFRGFEFIIKQRMKVPPSAFP